MTAARVFEAFYLLVALLYSRSADAQESDVPAQVQGVVALVTSDPSVVVVYWTPIMNDRIAAYTVYYRSNNATSNKETKLEVQKLFNSVVVKDLEVGQQYTFTVSASYVSSSSFVMGPRSEVTPDNNVTTSLSTANRLKESNGNDSIGITAVSFYGVLLMLSLVMNIILLVMSMILLRQLKMKYRLGSSNNTSFNDPIELKVIRQSNDIPSKPEREYSPTVKEAINNAFDEQSPPKEADMEI